MRSRFQRWIVMIRHPSVPPPAGNTGGFHPPASPKAHLLANDQRLKPLESLF